MKTNPVARRHHYLPQAYLAGFTSTGSKDGQFYVIDRKRNHTFRTSPINVAAQRDFNRVDIEGHPPDAIENALAPFEKDAADAIRRVIKTQNFPNDADWNFILNLFGLIAVRNPRFRGSFNRSREEVIRHLGTLLVSDRKVWDDHGKAARKSGGDISNSVSFEDARRFIDEGKYRIEFYPQGNLRVEFRAFDELLPLLGQRIWSVLVAPAEGPEFICSDHPVTLYRKGGGSEPTGFGHKETEVFFPLGSRVGFYGVFENPYSQVVTCDPKDIAAMNLRIASNSERHIYSAENHFVVLYEEQIREVQCEV